MKNFKSRRGLIIGIVSVVVLLVIAAVVLRMQGVSADTAGGLNHFVAYRGGSVCDTAQDAKSFPLIDKEIAILKTMGVSYDTAVAHLFVLNGVQLRAVVTAKELSKSGSGGNVKFTVLYQPSQLSLHTYPYSVYTEKKGRWMLVFNDEKYLDFYYGNPGLKVGAYQQLDQTVFISDYSSAQKIDLQLRNGTGYNFKGCVKQVMNLTQVLTPLSKLQQYPSEQKTCASVQSMESSQPTANELAILKGRGANYDKAVAYVMNNTGQPGTQFRTIITAKEMWKSGSGGVVKFSVLYTPSQLSTANYPQQIYTEKKGRWMLVFNDEKYLDFYFDNPNLKLGAYRQMDRTVSVPDYSSAQEIDLQLRNGSGFYLQGCVKQAINLGQII